MSDIDAYLKEAINGPAPQHKIKGVNRFEISEGSNGAPHTKLVDVEGNPIDPRDVNFPQVQKVEDIDVKTELASIKQTQAEILAKLDGTIDTRVTGSVDEYALPVKSSGGKVVEKELLDRQIRSQSLTQVFETSVSPEIKQVIIILRVYGVTGSFAEGEGYRSIIRKHTRDAVQAYDVASAKRVTTDGNGSGNLFTIDPTFRDKSFDSDDKYQLIQDTLFPSYRFQLFISGTFLDGEGVDCDAVAHYIY